MSDYIVFNLPENLDSIGKNISKFSDNLNVLYKNVLEYLHNLKQVIVGYFNGNLILQLEFEGKNALIKVNNSLVEVKKNETTDDTNILIFGIIFMFVYPLIEHCIRNANPSNVFQIRFRSLLNEGKNAILSTFRTFYVDGGDFLRSKFQSFCEDGANVLYEFKSRFESPFSNGEGIFRVVSSRVHSLVEDEGNDSLVDGKIPNVLLKLPSIVGDNIEGKCSALVNCVSNINNNDRYFQMRRDIINHMINLNEVKLTIEEYKVYLNDMIRNLEVLDSKYFKDYTGKRTCLLPHICSLDNAKDSLPDNDHQFAEVNIMFMSFLRYTSIIYSSLYTTRNQDTIFYQGLRSLIEGIKATSNDDEVFEDEIERKIDLSNTQFIFCGNNILLDHYTLVKSIKAQLCRHVMEWLAQLRDVEGNLEDHNVIQTQLTNCIMTFQYNPRDVLVDDDDLDYTRIIHPYTKILNRLRVTASDADDCDGINVCTDTEGKVSLEVIPRADLLYEIGDIYYFKPILNYYIQKANKFNLDGVHDIYEGVDFSRYTRKNHRKCCEGSTTSSSPDKPLCSSGINLLQVHVMNVIDYILSLDFDRSILKNRKPMKVKKPERTNKFVKKVRFVNKPTIIPKTKYVRDPSIHIDLFSSRSSDHNLMDPSTIFPDMSLALELIKQKYGKNLEGLNNDMGVRDSKRLKAYIDIFERKFNRGDCDYDLDEKWINALIDISYPSINLVNIVHKLNILLSHTSEYDPFGFIFNRLSILLSELSSILGLSSGDSFKNNIELSLDISCEMIADNVESFTRLDSIKYLIDMIEEVIKSLSSIFMDGNSRIDILSDSRKAVELLYVKVYCMIQLLHVDIVCDTKSITDLNGINTLEYGPESIYEPIFAMINDKLKMIFERDDGFYSFDLNVPRPGTIINNGHEGGDIVSYSENNQGTLSNTQDGDARRWISAGSGGEDDYNNNSGRLIGSGSWSDVGSVDCRRSEKDDDDDDEEETETETDFWEAEGKLIEEAVCKTNGGMTNRKESTNVTSSELPGSDPRELEGEVNKKAVCKTTPGGEADGRNVTSSGTAGGEEKVEIKFWDMDEIVEEVREEEESKADFWDVEESKMEEEEAVTISPLILEPEPVIVQVPTLVSDPAPSYVDEKFSCHEDYEVSSQDEVSCQYPEDVSDDYMEFMDDISCSDGLERFINVLYDVSLYIESKFIDVAGSPFTSLYGVFGHDEGGYFLWVDGLIDDLNDDNQYGNQDDYLIFNGSLDLYDNNESDEYQPFKYYPRSNATLFNMTSQNDGDNLPHLYVIDEEDEFNEWDMSSPRDDDNEFNLPNGWDSNPFSWDDKSLDSFKWNDDTSNTFSWTGTSPNTFSCNDKSPHSFKWSMDSPHTNDFDLSQYMNENIILIDISSKDEVININENKFSKIELLPHDYVDDTNYDNCRASICNVEDPTQQFINDESNNKIFYNKKPHNVNRRYNTTNCVFKSIINDDIIPKRSYTYSITLNNNHRNDTQINNETIISDLPLSIDYTPLTSSIVSQRSTSLEDTSFPMPPLEVHSNSDPPEVVLQTAPLFSCPSASLRSAAGSTRGPVLHFIPLEVTSNISLAPSSIIPMMDDPSLPSPRSPGVALPFTGSELGEAPRLVEDKDLSMATDAPLLLEDMFTTSGSTLDTSIGEFESVIHDDKRTMSLPSVLEPLSQSPTVKLTSDSFYLEYVHKHEMNNPSIDCDDGPLHADDEGLILNKNDSPFTGIKNIASDKDVKFYEEMDNIVMEYLDEYFNDNNPVFNGEYLDDFNEDLFKFNAVDDNLKNELDYTNDENNIKTSIATTGSTEDSICISPEIIGQHLNTNGSSNLWGRPKIVIYNGSIFIDNLMIDNDNDSVYHLIAHLTGIDYIYSTLYYWIHCPMLCDAPQWNINFSLTYLLFSSNTVYYTFKEDFRNIKFRGDNFKLFFKDDSNSSKGNNFNGGKSTEEERVVKSSQEEVKVCKGDVKSSQEALLVDRVPILNAPEKRKSEQSEDDGDRVIKESSTPKERASSSSATNFSAGRVSSSSSNGVNIFNFDDPFSIARGFIPKIKMSYSTIMDFIMNDEIFSLFPACLENRVSTLVKDFECRSEEIKSTTNTCVSSSTTSSPNPYHYHHSTITTHHPPLHSHPPPHPKSTTSTHPSSRHFPSSSLRSSLSSSSIRSLTTAPPSSSSSSLHSVIPPPPPPQRTPSRLNTHRLGVDNFASFDYSDDVYGFGFKRGNKSGRENEINKGDYSKRVDGDGNGYFSISKITAKLKSFGRMKINENRATKTDDFCSGKCKINTTDKSGCGVFYPSDVNYLQSINSGVTENQSVSYTLSDDSSINTCSINNSYYLNNESNPPSPQIIDDFETPINIIDFFKSLIYWVSRRFDRIENGCIISFNEMPSLLDADVLKRLNKIFIRVDGYVGSIFDISDDNNDGFMEFELSNDSSNLYLSRFFSNDKIYKIQNNNNIIWEHNHLNNTFCMFIDYIFDLFGKHLIKTIGIMGQNGVKYLVSLDGDVWNELSMDRYELLWDALEFGVSNIDIFNVEDAYNRIGEPSSYTECYFSIYSPDFYEKYNDSNRFKSFYGNMGGFKVDLIEPLTPFSSPQSSQVGVDDDFKAIHSRMINGVFLKHFTLSKPRPNVGYYRYLNINDRISSIHDNGGNLIWSMADGDNYCIDFIYIMMNNDMILSLLTFRYNKLYLAKIENQWIQVNQYTYYTLLIRVLHGAIYVPSVDDFRGGDGNVEECRGCDDCWEENVVIDEGGIDGTDDINTNQFSIDDTSIQQASTIFPCDKGQIVPDIKVNESRRNIEDAECKAKTGESQLIIDTALNTTRDCTSAEDQETPKEDVFPFKDETLSNNSDEKLKEITPQDPCGDMKTTTEERSSERSEEGISEERGSEGGGSEERSDEGGSDDRTSDRIEEDVEEKYNPLFFEEHNLPSSLRSSEIPPSLQSSSRALCNYMRYMSVEGPTEDMILDVSVRGYSDRFELVLMRTQVSLCYQYFPKSGSISRVIDGNIIIWDGSGIDKCSSVILYYSKLKKKFMAYILQIIGYPDHYLYFDMRYNGWSWIHVNNFGDLLLKFERDHHITPIKSLKIYTDHNNVTPLLIGYITKCGVVLGGSAAILKIKYKGYKNCKKLISYNGNYDPDYCVNAIYEELEKIYTIKCYIPEGIDENRIIIDDIPITFDEYPIPIEPIPPNYPSIQFNYDYTPQLSNEYKSASMFGTFETPSFLTERVQGKWICVYVMENDDLLLMDNNIKLSYSDILSGLEESYTSVKEYILNEFKKPLKLTVVRDDTINCLMFKLKLNINTIYTYLLSFNIKLLKIISSKLKFNICDHLYLFYVKLIINWYILLYKYNKKKLLYKLYHNHHVNIYLKHTIIIINLNYSQNTIKFVKSIPYHKKYTQITSLHHPHEVTTTVPLATPPEVKSTSSSTRRGASSNSLPVNGNTTPRDRGDINPEEQTSIVVDVTSSGLPVADLREANGEVIKRGRLQDEDKVGGGMRKTVIGPRVEPAADLREAEGEVIKRADGRNVTSGGDVDIMTGELIDDIDDQSSSSSSMDYKKKVCMHGVVRRLVHPTEMENPSSFLKVYGDPLCDLAKNTKVNVNMGVDGNWRCYSCNNINFPRRIYCNQCSTKRNKDGDSIVLKYAIQLYNKYINGDYNLESTIRNKVVINKKINLKVKIMGIMGTFNLLIMM